MAGESGTLSRPAMHGSPAPSLQGERSLAGVVAAGALSSAAVALLLVLLPWDQVRTLWRALAPLPLVVAAAAIALGHVATAFRIRTMLPPGVRVRFVDGVLASLWHGIAMVLLPVRLGELALVEALSRYAGVARGVGLAVLLVQRIYDALLACAAFAIGAYGAMLGRAPFVLLAAAIAALLALSWWLEPLLGWLARAVARVPGRAGERLQALLLDARGGVQATSRDRAPVLAFGTLLFWATEFLAFWLVFLAFGTTLDLFTTLFLAAGLALVYALPLPTIGGLGIAEGGLVALLVAAGWPAETALGLGVSARLTLLVLQGVVVGLLLPPLALRRGAR